MYKVCSTLLGSLEEVFKATRRTICNTISSSLMLVLSAIVKKTAKYYTKEELENLKKKGEELNASIAVIFTYEKALLLESIHEIPYIYSYSWRRCNSSSKTSITSAATCASSYEERYQSRTIKGI